MDFGVGVVPDQHPARLAELFRSAEEMGVDYVWPIDTQLVARDSYIVLALTAYLTKRIRMGPCVTNPFTRHISVIANCIQCVDEISGGRAILGLGAGESSIVPLGFKPSAKECEEAVKAARELLAGRDLTLKTGKTIRLVGRASKVPIFIAAQRPKLLQMAGRLADGVIVSAGADPALISEALESVRAGASEAGRDPSSVYTVAWVGCSVSDERRVARDEAKTFAARRAFELAGRPKPPAAIAPIQKDIAVLAEKYDYLHELDPSAPHSKYITEEMLDMFTASGTPEDIARQLKSISSVGVNQISLMITTSRKQEALRDIGERVLPQLR